MAAYSNISTSELWFTKFLLKCKPVFEILEVWKKHFVACEQWQNKQPVHPHTDLCHSWGSPRCVVWCVCGVHVPLFPWNWLVPLFPPPNTYVPHFPQNLAIVPLKKMFFSCSLISTCLFPYFLPQNTYVPPYSQNLAFVPLLPWNKCSFRVPHSLW